MFNTHVISVLVLFGHATFEVVDHYVYLTIQLGQSISRKKSIDESNLARQRSGNFKSDLVIQYSTVSANKVYNRNFCTETWSLRVNLIKRLKVTQCTMERVIRYFSCLLYVIKFGIQKYIEETNLPRGFNILKRQLKRVVPFFYVSTYSVISNIYQISTYHGQ